MPAIDIGNPEVPRNNYWAVLVMLPGVTEVFKMDKQPKARRIIEMATLIIGPNDLKPLKDRFGLMGLHCRSSSTEEQVLAAINNPFADLTK